MKLSTKSETTLSLFNRNRLLILRAIFECHDDVCGCDLVDKLDLPKNLVSYHVKMLEKMGYLYATRCGQKKIYQINAQKLAKVVQILRLVELV